MSSVTEDPYDYEANQEAEAEEQRLKALQEADDLRSVLATEQGRRFMWRLLTQTGVFKSTFTGDNETFFLEGQRNIGLFLLQDIMGLCPERFTEMMENENE